ncbi:MAG: hypothetical protein ACREJC_00240, partial [Tepidisphaeraceae bacterium]
PAEVVQTKLGLYEGYLWQGHYEKMEPLAVALVDEAHSVPGVVQEKFVTDSMRLVIQMYEGWGKPEKAAPYRNRLQTRGSGPARPSSAP